MRSNRDRELRAFLKFPSKGPPPNLAARVDDIIKLAADNLRDAKRRASDRSPARIRERLKKVEHHTKELVELLSLEGELSELGDSVPLQVDVRPNWRSRVTGRTVDIGIVPALAVIHWRAQVRLQSDELTGRLTGAHNRVIKSTRDLNRTIFAWYYRHLAKEAGQQPPMLADIADFCEYCEQEVNAKVASDPTVTVGKRPRIRRRGP